MGFKVYAAELLIKGAGATLPYPIYSKWFDSYSYQTGGVHFGYQSIGSGGGVEKIIAQTVDFGATDAPMNNKEMEKASGSHSAHSDGCKCHCGYLQLEWTRFGP